MGGDLLLLGYPLLLPWNVGRKEEIMHPWNERTATEGALDVPCGRWLTLFCWSSSTEHGPS